MVQGVLAPILTDEGIHWEERTGGKLDIPTTARDATSLRIEGLVLIEPGSGEPLSGRRSLQRRRWPMP